jgi:serine/threonine protein kinase
MTTHANLYSGLRMMKEQHLHHWDDSYSPYINESFMIGGECNGSPNFFTEIILPFMDEEYRTFIHLRNNFFVKNGVSPFNLWETWIGLNMAETYSIQNFLANGSNGAVYKICDKEENCKAMKIQYDEFKKMIKHMESLNPVTEEEYMNSIYDIRQHGFYMFMLMELGEMDLSEVIYQTNITTLQKLNLIRDILQALHNFLKHKVIHKDLKPGNILIKYDENANPVIKDIPNKPPPPPLINTCDITDTRCQIKNYFAKNNKNLRDKNLIPMFTDFEGVGRVVTKNEKNYKDWRFTQGDKILLSDKVSLYDVNLLFTPAYKAYEAHKIDPVKRFGPGVDLYAIGMTIYEIWYERLPKEITKEKKFKKANRKIIYKVQKEVRKSLREMNLDEKTEENCVVDIVKGMIRLNPLKRRKPLASIKRFLNCLKEIGYQIEDLGDGNE